MTLTGLFLARHVALPDHGVGLDGQSCSCLIVGWPVGLSSPTLGYKALILELAGRVSRRTGLGRRVNFMTLTGLSPARHVALLDHGVGLDGQSSSCLIVGWPVGLSSPTLSVVETVIPSFNEDPTEEYDEDYWKERALEIAIQDEKYSSHSFTNTSPPSIDRVYSDPHVHYNPSPVKKPQTSSRRITDPGIIAPCHCGAEYETKYSASVETHTVTSIDSAHQKSTDIPGEESVDSSQEDWENDYYKPTLTTYT
ncbi:hypothetical protein F2Q69_00053458 [Brassica cretica]|uniref:Uncharacterized protein n=1 Tax=Brassica cretica TaxID=69181 RepID=A0A8S9N3T2_BRACR|nr:hypothetical protein F2Q69_00053458 [Brassica cretica]